MKAVVVSGPFTTELQDVPLQEMGPGDVRIRVLAAGVCGTDVEIFEGTMPYFTRRLASYPIIPGHEWVGDIVECGSAVQGFSVGDRVVGECSIGCMQCQRCRTGSYHRCDSRSETGILRQMGGFAEFITFPAASLHSISKDIPPETACLTEPAAIAFNGVRLAAVSPSDQVVIFGDGSIGLLLLMMAKAFGAQKIALVGVIPRRLEVARSLGASAVIEANGSDIKSAIQSHGIQPTVVIEATGNPDAASSAISVIEPGGRVILQGLFAGETSNRLDLDQIVVSDLSIRGALGSPGIWPQVIQLIESRTIDPGRIVTHLMNLSQFENAIGCVKRREGIKVVLKPH